MPEPEETVEEGLDRLEREQPFNSHVYDYQRIQLGRGIALWYYSAWASAVWLVLWALAFGLTHRFGWTRFDGWSVTGFCAAGLVLTEIVIAFPLSLFRSRGWAISFLQILPMLLLILLLGGLCGSPVAGVVYLIAR